MEQQRCSNLPLKKSGEEQKIKQSVNEVKANFGDEYL